MKSWPPSSHFYNERPVLFLAMRRGGNKSGTLSLSEVFDNVVGRSRKEMDVKNTGLAAGKNFLIESGTRRSATTMRNRYANAYLALKWQPTETDVLVTSRARRFPTPSQRSKYQCDASAARKKFAIAGCITAPAIVAASRNCTRCAGGAADMFVTVFSEGVTAFAFAIGGLP
jgi:hypothetical protein